jgi:hypothetical protein
VPGRWRRLVWGSRELCLYVVSALIVGVSDTTVESGAAPERVMPANVSGGAVPFPVRGVLGGWRDEWSDPDDHAALRANAQEPTGMADASVLLQRSAGREPEHCSRPAGR